MVNHIRKEIIQLVEEYEKIEERDIYNLPNNFINIIQNELHITQKESSVFLNILLYLLINNTDGTYLSDIKKFFELSASENLYLIETINSLMDKNILDIQENRGYRVERHRNVRKNSDRINPFIIIDPLIFDKIMYGKSTFDDIDESDEFSLITFIFNFIDSVCENNLSLGKFKIVLSDFENKYSSKSAFIKRIKKYSLIEKVLAYNATADYLFNTSSGDVKIILDYFTSSKSEIAKINKKILNEKLSIIKDEILEKVKSHSLFASTRRITLNISEKVIEEDFEFKEEEKFTVRNRMIKHIKNSDIPSKTLFFSGELKNNIDDLYSATTKKSFKSLQSRLKKNKLPTGMVSLLYGVPGTGKTAVVYDIAKKTKRDIFHVDISNIKDKFVGESEKRLKSIFDTYRKACDKLPTEPILLFNEADALFGKRISVNNSVDQMYNAMQNILLEELETFAGLFFATTNLTENIDDAFNRRFLFKQKFDKPSAEIRKRIWKSKLPTLSDSDLNAVNKYELSGGQIENIVKKNIIKNVLKDRELTIDELLRSVKEEYKFKNEEAKKIGF